MSASLADRLEIWGFENDFVIFSDGSFGFGARLSTVDASCWDNDQVDAFAEKLANFLNSLPENLDVQLVQEIKPENYALLKKNESLGSKAVDATSRMVHTSRLEFLRVQDEKGIIPRYELLIFCRKAPTSPLIEKPKLFSKSKLFEKIAEQNLERELKFLGHFRDEVASSLATLGLKVTLLNERQISDYIYRDWNPTRPIELGEYDPENIRSSLLFTDVSIYETGFLLGDLYHRIISLKLLPDQTYASMARVLARLPFSSRLYLSIQVPNQQQELEKLQSQRRLAYSMARGKKTGVSDIESEAKFQDLETLVSQMVAQGEKVFHFSLNVVLRSKSEEELHEQASQTLAVLRELSGAEGMEETIATFDIFSEVSIPNSRARERSKRIKTSNLTDLLPVFGPWAGHEVPRLLLKTNQGCLLPFDPFSSELSNYNQIITGGSGSGKSFLTNCLLLQMLKENPKIYIVDIGGSYKKLCENLTGQYIPFQLDTDLALNPFDLSKDETEVSAHKIKFLVGLVEMMTKETGESGIGRLERAEIEEAIQKTYRAANPCLSNLRKILLENADPEIQRFGKILTPWCGNTPFGRLVDRPTSVALHKSIVSFDLKGLEAHPDLQSVCLYLITDFVWREVQRDRKALKFLVFDECWKLLESDAGSAFIAEVFRTFRKYFASAVAISQNIDDFAKSKVAGAVLPNTSLKWVLMQKGADQKRLKEVLQLNDNEMSLIASLHQSRGNYSQAFLMAEDKHCLVSIEPTPLEYWIATTDPRDLSAFQEHIKLNPNSTQLEGLIALSEKFPRGISQ